MEVEAMRQIAPEAMSRLSHVNDGKGGRGTNSVNGRVTSGEGVNRINGRELEVASTLSETVKVSSSSDTRDVVDCS